MHKLDKLVKNMLSQHVGGEVFFDHLDEAIRNNERIVDALIAKIPNIEKQIIIVSGRFGQFFKNYLKVLEIEPKEIIWVEGGLRQGNKPKNLEHYIIDQDVLFIDDSFYSGKTRDVISEALAERRFKISNTYVVYDGSHEKENNVHSLYRYYKEIRYLLISLTDEDANGQYTSGPNKYNLTLGFETREEAEKELEEYKDLYTKNSTSCKRNATIVKLAEPLTDYDSLYNGWQYNNK